MLCGVFRCGMQAFSSCATRASHCSAWAFLVVGCGLNLEKALAPHSSTLAWKIPWMEEPGGLQSMGWLRVGHD